VLCMYMETDNEVWGEGGSLGLRCTLRLAVPTSLPTAKYVLKGAVMVRVVRRDCACRVACRVQYAILDTQHQAWYASEICRFWCHYVCTHVQHSPSLRHFDSGHTEAPCRITAWVLKQARTAKLSLPHSPAALSRSVMAEQLVGCHSVIRAST